MKKMKHDVPIRLVKVLILILMMVAFGFVWYGYYAARAQVHYYRRGDWVVILLFGILYYGSADPMTRSIFLSVRFLRLFTARRWH